LIQISDLIGGYGVSFLVMFVSACIVATVCGLQRRWTAWPAVAAVVALSASWGYGVVRVAQMDQLPASAGQTRIALIQGSIDTTFDEDQDPSATFDQYHRLSQQANDEHAPLDAIIWPESMYTPAWFEAESPVQPPPDTGSGPDAYRRYVQTLVEHCRREAQRLANDLSTTLVLGSATFAFGPYEPRRFNSAICVAADGRVLGRYDKMHPVMFGEYVPLGNVFPWLYNLTPMGTGLTAGQRPLHVAVDGVGISPCICFENTIPHLIRRQVLELKKEGHDPDVLLTITNDGWFWGSSLLDLH
jgi:apolipoprotein N-acyltransferase